MIFLPALLAFLVGIPAGICIWYYFHERETRFTTRIRELENALRDKNREQADLAPKLGSQELEFGVSLIYSVEAGIVAVDSEEKIVLINPYAERKGKWAKEEYLGKPFSSFPIRVEGELPQLFKSALRGHTVDLPEKATLSVRGGEELPIFGSVCPLKSKGSETTGVVLVFRDAKAIRNSELERKTFFSTAAHELRTPLTVIKTGISLLLAHESTQSQEKQQEMIALVNTAVNQLSDLVNDLLQVSRIEQGRIEFKKEAVDMVAVTKEIIQEYEPLAKEKKLYLTHETLPSLPKVLGDTMKIREVILNLVSNAVKYTYQGGVAVTQKIEADRIVTHVSDTGTGIPLREHRLLFQKFQQIGEARAHSTAKSTGLGLYIAKNLVQQMGGELSLESSEPGKGTTFSFWLPVYHG